MGSAGLLTSGQASKGQEPGWDQGKDQRGRAGPLWDPCKDPRVQRPWGQPVCTGCCLGSSAEEV